MGITDWLGSAMNTNKDVTVKKIKKQSIDIGAMAAGNPSEAAEALSRIMDQQNRPSKVLMVQDGEYMPQVTEYALKMAQRLDCDIIALDVTDNPLQFSGERRIRESDRFIDMARKSAQEFTRLAQSRGIKVQHIMDIGVTQDIIARVSAIDAGIRYVLKKPDKKIARGNQGYAKVQPFTLRCSKL